MLKIIELLIPLVGVVVGFLCSELSKYFADRYKKRQTINRAISLLLELYFQIKRISVAIEQSQSFIEWYLAQFKEISYSKDEEKILRNALSDTINPLIKELASGDIEKINSDYDCVLKELSCYYPVDAYRLRGRNDIKKKLPINYDEYSRIASVVKPLVQSQAIQDQLSAIKDEIETLSKEDVKCYQRRKIIETLKNIDKDDKFAKSFEEIKQKIIEALKDYQLIV